MKERAAQFVAVSHDSAVETEIGAAGGCGRDAVTREVCRGVCRLLRALNVANVKELMLPNGRRADVVGLSPAGDFSIVEVKSSLEDFRVDSKWPEYRDFCDVFYFAVAPDFPRNILPADTGLILADRFGAEIVRPAPGHKLPAARRKVMTIRFARAAAFSLQAQADPAPENS